MAELSDFKPVVCITPIWRRKKRIKSFKQAALMVVQLMRLGAHTHLSSLTAETMAEQLKELANEDQAKEERIKKVQRLAKIKTKENVELEEWKQHYLKIYREKFHRLTLFEKMNRYNGNHWMGKATNNATLMPFGIENRKLAIGSPTLMMNQKLATERNAITPAPRSRLTDDCVLKRSNEIVRRIAVEPHQADGRLNSSHQLINGSTKDIKKNLQVTSLGGKHDPRFQKLLRSLTPIGS